MLKVELGVSGLSGLTLIIFSIGLTHFGSEASNYLNVISFTASDMIICVGDMTYVLQKIKVKFLKCFNFYLSLTNFQKIVVLLRKF